MLSEGKRSLIIIRSSASNTTVAVTAEIGVVVAVTAAAGGSRDSAHSMIVEIGAPAATDCSPPQSSSTCSRHCRARIEIQLVARQIKIQLKPEYQFLNFRTELGAPYPPPSRADRARDGYRCMEDNSHL